MWFVSKDVSDIKASLSRLEAHQVEIKEDLKDHIKRTANLEGRTESIEAHVHMVQGVMKFMAFLSIVAAIVGTIVSVYFSFFPRT